MHTAVVLVLLLAAAAVSARPACLDETGRPVDWWYRCPLVTPPALPFATVTSSSNSLPLCRIMLKVPVLPLSPDPNAASGNVFYLSVLFGCSHPVGACLAGYGYVYADQRNPKLNMTDKVFSK
jgi:hypothetical protein